LYPVPSLTIPDIQPIESLEKLSDYESIRLFDERAQLVQMDFGLTSQNASSVAQICHRLDGIPLAIELAAVRIQTFSTEQIATQLNECFHILTGGNRTLPRHQTLQASIDWSWHLLSDAEQTLLRRLAVFADGFTLEAASHICSENGIDAHHILDVTTQLVQKSLVVENQARPEFDRRDSGREKRYRLLETIRQYAHEKLVETGEEEIIRTQHLKYYLQLSEQAEPALKGPTQMDWYAGLKDERGNLHTALDWADKTNVEAGLFISGRLTRFWEDLDMREGAHWLNKFLDNPKSHQYPRARAKALYAYGILLHLTQQNPLLLKTAEECLALHRASGDQQGQVDGLVLLARFMWASQNIGQAEELYQQALDLSESVGDEWRKGFVMAHMGWLINDFQRQTFYWKESIRLSRKLGDLRLLGDCLYPLSYYEISNGDIESAKKNLEEALQLNRTLKLERSMGNILKGLSRIEIINGNLEKARVLLEESIDATMQLGHRMNYLWERALLGHLIVQQGDIAEARVVLIDTIQEFIKDKNEIGIVYSSEGMAGLYVATTRHEDAAKLIGWADATREKIRDKRPPSEQADVDKVIAVCIATMGEVAFSDAYEEGKKMTLNEAVALALNE